MNSKIRTNGKGKLNLKCKLGALLLASALGAPISASAAEDTYSADPKSFTQAFLQCAWGVSQGANCCSSNPKYFGRPGNIDAEYGLDSTNHWRFGKQQGIYRTSEYGCRLWKVTDGGVRSPSGYEFFSSNPEEFVPATVNPVWEGRKEQ